MDVSDGSITFSIASVPDGRELYRRKIPARLKMNSIFDSEGFAASVRVCLEQFVRDPDALTALSAPLPEEPSAVSRPVAPAVGGGKAWWQ